MSRVLPTLEIMTLPTSQVADNIYYGTADFEGRVTPHASTDICYYEVRFVSSLRRPTGVRFAAAQPVLIHWSIGMPMQDRAFQYLEVGCHDLATENVDSVSFNVSMGFRDALWTEGAPITVSGQLGLTIYTAQLSPGGAEQ